MNQMNWACRTVPFLALTLSFLSSPVLAKTDYVPSIGQEPAVRRVVTAASSPELRMIGRLERWSKNSQGQRVLAEICTAALVGAQEILTAAHCVSGGVDSPVHEYIFKAGYERGVAKASSIVTSWIAAGVSPAEAETMSDYAHDDWAILGLQDRLGDSLGFFPVAEASITAMQARKLSIVGYAGDFENLEVMVQQEQCFVLGDVKSYRIDSPYYRNGALPYIRDLQRDPSTHDTLFHNCTTTPGYSGAPMLIREGDQSVIVGIHIAGPPTTEALDMPAGAAPARGAAAALHR